MRTCHTHPGKVDQPAVLQHTLNGTPFTTQVRDRLVSRHARPQAPPTAHPKPGPETPSRTCHSFSFRAASFSASSRSCSELSVRWSGTARLGAGGSGVSARG